MSFDPQTNLPLMQPRKKTTQVNIGVVVAVLVFFAIVGGVLWAVVRNPVSTREERYEKAQDRLDNERREDAGKEPAR